MPTIRDVADAAGVSIATVSRVFNGIAEVSDETRTKVIDAASVLNYKPHISARNLRRRRSGKISLTYTVGMVFFKAPVFARDPFFSELLAGLEESLRQRGFAIRIIVCDSNGQVPQEIIQHEVDGVIVRGTGTVVSDIAQVVPTVTLDAYSLDSHAYGVIPDYKKGVYEAVKRLLASGHRKITMVTGKPGQGVVSFSDMCWEGANLACNGMNVPPNVLTAFQGASTPKEGYLAGCALFDSPDRPDTVVASDGGMLGIYRAAAERGISIPEDVSCVGIDGVAYGEFLTPPLTTVDVHIHDLGASATRVITDMLLSGDRRQGMELTPVNIIERQSARI